MGQRGYDIDEIGLNTEEESKEEGARTPRLRDGKRSLVVPRMLPRATLYSAKFSAQPVKKDERRNILRSVWM